MNKIKLILALFIGISISLVSCGDDDGGTLSIIDPETYVFERDGVSTVSFSGQSTRILMAEEIVSALSDKTLNEDNIHSMYSHVEGANDFEDATNFGLNASDKSVRNKTAASTDFFAANTTDATAIKEDFDSWIAGQVVEVFPNWETEASEGQAGFIQEAGGGSIRYVNAKGLEYNQMFGKSLIGALMVDQILNNYVSTLVLDAGTNQEDNNAQTVADGKSYTNMEHKWDEAYGYAYGTAVNTTTPNTTIGADDSFLNKYIGRVEGDDDFEGIADDIFNAFKLGRAAIVAGDYSTRDVQAEILREKISTIIAVRAVYYLQQGKNGLEASTVDYASVFHDLSEGYGFIYSLQFIRIANSELPYFSRAEVEDLLNDLIGGTNGLWDVTTTTLDDISNEIAAKFAFTVEQAGS
ncbi:DUF4856 domain-containing protein [Ekhidna sp.]|uniref:DUF4856 domain-containing protein n=1 Tax=Ekhidna sp. TaxID=2608089 RepID=UPI00329A06D4